MCAVASSAGNMSNLESSIGFESSYLLGHTPTHHLPRKSVRKTDHSWMELEINHAGNSSLSGVLPNHKSPRSRGQVDDGYGRGFSSDKDFDSS
ncbi:hypothetical protein V6N13_089400 [Hibiscus sabdariffa]